MTAIHTDGTVLGASSTATDVLAGLDLTGSLAVVTGGYSGLGLEITRALTAVGAQVIVPARRPAAARAALDGVDRVEVDELDLADLGSVHGFAERLLASSRSVNLVIANAGVMACPETRVEPGWEAQFAVNHLGHYALVNRLWPALAAAGHARVVVAASGVSRIHWEDVQFERGYDKWAAYLQSKTANRLFAAHLDRCGAPYGVRSFSATPGYILTPLQRHLPAAEMVAAGWIDEHGHPIDPTFKTPQQGAATQVWAATAPELAEAGGVHCEDCTVVGPILATVDVPPDDPARLWAYSAKLSDVNAFAADLP